MREATARLGARGSGEAAGALAGLPRTQLLSGAAAGLFTGFCNSELLLTLRVRESGSHSRPETPSDDAQGDRAARVRGGFL